MTIILMYALAVAILATATASAIPAHAVDYFAITELGNTFPIELIDPNEDGIDDFILSLPVMSRIVYADTPQYVIFDHPDCPGLLSHEYSVPYCGMEAVKPLMAYPNKTSITVGQFEKKRDAEYSFIPPFVPWWVTPYVPNRDDCYRTASGIGLNVSGAAQPPPVNTPGNGGRWMTSTMEYDFASLDVEEYVYEMRDLSDLSEDDFVEFYITAVMELNGAVPANSISDTWYQRGSSNIWLQIVNPTITISQ